MHSMAYSIEGLMATMIAELICLIRYKGAPNADYLLLTVRGEVAPVVHRTTCSAAVGGCVRSAARAKPGQCVDSAIGSSAHAVTVSWAMICFAQFAQVGR
jgi:hypothetical protein